MNFNYLSVSLKDYLQVIYCIQIKEGIVRVTDIAALMQVSKPSVCRAIRQLEKYGLVIHECYQPFYLTDKGLGLGRELLEEFRTIRYFLADILGVNEEVADYEARKIAHILSNATMGRLKILADTNFKSLQVYEMVSSL